MNGIFKKYAEPIENGIRTRFTDVIVKTNSVTNNPSELPELLRGRGFGRYAVITDSAVWEKYGQHLYEDVMRLDPSARYYVFPEGERSKNVQTWESLIEQLADDGYTKNSAIIGVGGGVVGDVTGFVAHAFKRGVPCVHVPTTIMALIDSCLGGKVALDTTHGKNLAGAIHHPVLCIVDPSTATSLPKREYRSGLAEMVKYGAIDQDFGAELEAGLDRVLLQDIEILPKYVLQSLSIKAFYVGEDQFDKGPRQVLNFGHTIGHGVEFASGYRLTHGEAVAIGMNYEGGVAVRNGLWTPQKLNTITTMLQRIGLPTELPGDIDEQKVMGAIRQDKKKDDKDVKLVVPGKDPSAPISVRVTEDELREALFTPD